MNAEFCGNLAVYPKSHHLIEQYFAEKGFAELQQKGLETFQHLPLAKPVQIQAKAGDIIITHYMLAHTIAPNCSPHVRYAVYFRVNLHPDVTFHPQSMLNMWQDWHGLKDIVAQQKPFKLKLLQEAKGSEAIRPIYADQFFKMQHKNTAASQASQVEELWKKGNSLFDAHKFKEAQPIFKQLVELLEDDFVALIKAGCCYTFSANDADAVIAESYIEKCIDLAPALPSGYTLLAQNMVRQKKYDKVIPLVKVVLACPVQDETSNNIIDALNCAKDALVALNQTNQLQPLLHEAKQTYPKLSSQIDKVASDTSIQSLWVKGKQWIASPVKDFNAGFQLFAQIVEKSPTDYWATLLMGGCKMWGGNAKDGEPYIRKAIQLDKSVPNGHSALAQNLLMQGKFLEVVPVVTEMFENDFPSIASDADHASKIPEALTCAKTVLKANNPIYIALVKKAKLKYKSIAHLLDAA